MAVRVGARSGATRDHPEPSELDLLRASGHLAVEMEAAGLFGVAASEGVAAAALLTVSDHLNGDTHRLSEQLGAPVLLAYFATW